MDTIASFLDWLHSEGRDPKTIQAYKIILNQYISWFSGTYEHSHIQTSKPIDIKEFISYLRHQKNRSQATINKSTAGLKTFFNFLADQGIITDNPTTRIKIQKISAAVSSHSGQTKWLTKQEQEKFLSYVDLERNEFKRLRNLAVVDILLYCGLRVSEVQDLKLDDIRVNGNIEITIREGKHGKYAVVTMLAKHAKNLRQWIRLRQSLTDGRYEGSPYVFVSERSGQFTVKGIQQMIDKYAALAGMDNVSPHAFRHSFCKNLANAGVNIETIRKLARHESIQTTSIYIDPSKEEQIVALSMM
ncbi:tyrosine-type recombinase/integrase [Heliobacterium undosum]|uniref:Tyrosine-type recombinase/integrase n=1 Tax=Heliomicrobium undosum TaxID=121734 RepID=A0A845LB26_9FIRM|nr:tyrosine-type recombinase/integrase [Heliomicrobium undosum]MZP30888.1 tyrosine-type recombinase/integrase [Heliomicrobium undosum]